MFATFALAGCTFCLIGLLYTSNEKIIEKLEQEFENAISRQDRRLNYCEMGKMGYVVIDEYGELP